MIEPTDLGTAKNGGYTTRRSKSGCYYHFGRVGTSRALCPVLGSTVTQSMGPVPTFPRGSEITKPQIFHTINTGIPTIYSAFYEYGDSHLSVSPQQPMPKRKGTRNTGRRRNERIQSNTILPEHNIICLYLDSLYHCSLPILSMKEINARNPFCGTLLEGQSLLLCICVCS